MGQYIYSKQGGGWKRVKSTYMSIGSVKAAGQENKRKWLPTDSNDQEKEKGYAMSTFSSSNSKRSYSERK